MLVHFNKRWKLLGLFIVFAAILELSFSLYFHLPPLKFVKIGSKVIATPVLAMIYSEDARTAERIRSSYWVGEKKLQRHSSLESWKSVERQLAGFQLRTYSDNESLKYDIPFVYEATTAPHIVEIRDRCRLDDVVKGSRDEYEAMLRLGAWIGTRWDHGSDEIPTGGKCHPVDIIEAGEKGSRFWCEIAARVTVYAATALGWPARVITASRDGHTWEHGIAELWSNQYGKWFVMDTDFNVVYEADGAPLSAFELCHQGVELEKAGRLQTRRFAPPKPSIPHICLIPYYKFVYIDLRNDWCSRRLSPGSPAGGALATWWTVRPPLSGYLTPRVRVDDPRKFNWPVNELSIHALGVSGAHGNVKLEIGLVGYSPFFEAFETAMDDEPWRVTGSSRYVIDVPPGQHTIKARIATFGGHKGPTRQVAFTYQGPAREAAVLHHTEARE